MKLKEASFKKTFQFNPGEKTLFNQLQWLLLFRVILYTLILALSYFLNESRLEVILLPQYHLLLFISIIYLVSIASAFYLNIVKTNLRKYGYLQCLLDTLFASFLVFYTGCSHSIFISLYFFPIIAGSLLIPNKGGLVSAAASTIEFSSILFLEHKKLYPTILEPYESVMMHDPVSMTNHFAVRGLTFFLAAILATIFATRLRKTEKALSDTQQSYNQLNILYKLVFDNISTGIITLDESNKITSTNKAAEIITGYPQQDLLGITLEKVFANITLTRDKQRQATDLTKQDGSTTRIGYSYAKFYPNPEESEKRTRLQPHKVLTIQDISEIEALEKKFRQSEKLAAIGMMSASIAHDFRNPLAAISGSAQILSSEYDKKRNKSEEVNFELTDIIIREAKRMTDTITNFLIFARPEHAQKEWFSLNNCLQETLQVFIASNVYSKTCRITMSLDEKIDIWADNKQIFRLLNELLTNAIAFCPPGNELIDILAQEITLDGKSYIEISISDNGPGFTMKNREMIFEPFYTSRTDGTGLGLAIVQRTIEEHNGEFLLESSQWGGARFTLRLPLP